MSTWLRRWQQKECSISDAVTMELYAHSAQLDSKKRTEMCRAEWVERVVCVCAYMCMSDGGCRGSANSVPCRGPALLRSEWRAAAWHRGMQCKLLSTTPLLYITHRHHYILLFIVQYCAWTAAPSLTQHTRQHTRHRAHNSVQQVFANISCSHTETGPS